MVNFENIMKMGDISMKRFAVICAMWEEAELLENNTDLNQGDSSFLLDSYNRMGEYSTLAKDRSREGNFRAKG